MLFRDEDCVLSWRLPHRSKSLRSPTTWLSGLPDEMRRHRNALQVFGYKGKQARDNIHSADLIRAFHELFKKPRSGQVYNIDGGRRSNCSMLEAIAQCERVTCNHFRWEYFDENRRGDHIWWISDLSKFQEHFPEWKITYAVPEILEEIYELNVERWRDTCLV